MSRIEEALARAGRDRISHGGGSGSERTRHESTLPPLHCPEDMCVPEPRLVVVNSPFSQQAEEYRKLKEAVVKKTKGESFRNLIMVTSPSAGDGKSVTAINLAASLAQEYDHTVLLVDADLRAPACHKYLGIAPSEGLSDCLVDGKDIGSALIKTGIGRLVFLPAGRTIPNPSEVFASKSMKRLIQEVKQRYSDRFIIIDTPPVMPFAETRTLSSLMDGVLMVVREGKSSMGEVESSLRALGSNVLGLVYNESSESESTAYGYKYYG
ncbi:XrtA-associated tyrosine autokinase [Desulfohalovibrio reitneri]|uniref:XrtA-associated tyrosine autokinase n=1 Tax=Desulfohalovibrio reitneri TaxID=1307759 RepID=UPI0004A78628|nr:XrtA-associated tyrosine autokinase [Desulfohalovibrio reitneri]